MAGAQGDTPERGEPRGARVSGRDVAAPPSAPAFLESSGLDRLIVGLIGRGYQVIGPVARDGAIVHQPVTSTADLPAGWTDEQDAGRYRLTHRGGAALFDYTLGPASWKPLLHPPQVALWRARRQGGELQFEDVAAPEPRYALLGVRACELHAIALHDRVFLSSPFADPIYRRRRESVFVVAVQCGRAGRTCFCESMGTGPAVSSGFDLALTECLEGATHGFVTVAGSEGGAEMLASLPHRPASDAEIRLAARAVERARGQMGRRIDTRELPELLARSLEHPRWEQVAGRCLTCGNCTQVCPTCFCTTVEDRLDLAGSSAERVRRWDSCFTLEYSYIHGGSVRASTRSRYRQWLTHKLGTWHRQFGTSGCVGCGRCITWCPAAIDLTEEVTAIRGGDPKKEAASGDA